MMKKIAMASLTTTAILLSANASAMTGVYLNGQLGYANQSADSSLPEVSLDSRSKKHFGYNIFLGYNYDFNEKYSLAGEIGYGDYGQTQWDDSSSSNSLRADQTATLMLLAGRYHFNEKFSSYLKAGFAFGVTDLDTGGTIMLSDGRTNERANNTRPMTVFGAAYNFKPELAANIEWQHIFGEKIKADHVNRFQTVDAFMIGLNYTFAA